MAGFIDSHAHLGDKAFDEDRQQAIERARQTGCEGIVCIGASIADAESARLLARANEGYIWFTAGVHPHDAASYDPARDLDALRGLLASGGVAVGECGLDYHYDSAPRELQRRAFANQLELARERGLPVVVHTRDAEDDTAAMVREAGAAGVRGVLHCFTGTRALADVALEAGWLISFSGIITFKAWTGDDVIRAVPEDRLLVESDSPYLAPVPHRGKRNEPAWVSFTVAHAAGARGAGADHLGRATAQNARRFFRLGVIS